MKKLTVVDEDTYFVTLQKGNISKDIYIKIGETTVAVISYKDGEFYLYEKTLKSFGLNIKTFKEEGL